MEILPAIPITVLVLVLVSSLGRNLAGQQRYQPTI